MQQKSGPTSHTCSILGVLLFSARVPVKVAPGTAPDVQPASLGGAGDIASGAPAHAIRQMKGQVETFAEQQVLINSMEDRRSNSAADVGAGENLREAASSATWGASASEQQVC